MLAINVQTMMLHADISNLRKLADAKSPPHSMGFSVPSKGSTQLRVCGLGAHPVATFIMWPHHKLCRATSVAELYDLLEEDYPDLDFRCALCPCMLLHSARNLVQSCQAWSPNTANTLIQ